VWLAALAISAGGCSDNDPGGHEEGIDASVGVDASKVADAMVVPDASPQPMTGFTARPLISDQAGLAPNHDAALVNAWGLAMDTRSFWIANNGSGQVLVVAADGSMSRFSPPLAALDLGKGITGIVPNTANAFKIGPSSNRAPAQMLVASEDGRIFGLNPTVARTPQVVVDRSVVNASYKGLAVFATSTGAMRLAAADFHNGRIDVFDSTFHLITTVVIVDPNLRAGLAPFNIVAIGSKVYVMYAVQDAAKADDVAGVGNGRIDVFDVDGNFVKVLLDGGHLNAPWGMAMATSGFGGGTAGMLIVGNFGDGTLLAIDPSTGSSTSLHTPRGEVLVIPGLWGLEFGNGQTVGATNELYFTSGPNREQHGLFGKIVLTTLAPS
jgi:uncharacterized protein (TIGR03118 family)